MISLIFLLSSSWSFYFLKIEGISQTFYGEGQPMYQSTTGTLWSFDISCYPYGIFGDGFESKPPFTLRDGLGKNFGMSDIELIGITYYLKPAKPNSFFCFQGIIIEN